ncbi:AAA family ATPase [Rhizobium sp. WSM1274]|uniref:AAA family ATPase n=1 Tax=Rhizobium sp. WSM1274 TaxID=3138254 RepID=UPI0021A8A97C|nr:AAA family ATPase [Rhizobium leguminosarum]UWU27747.1 AAA family ATPase [Rhizobium leguminosarum bv. viciae]
MNDMFPGFSLKISNFKCFGAEATGFERISPINLIIGRNNSGKSALVDALALALSRGRDYKPKLHRRAQSDFRFRTTAVLTETELRKVFPENTAGGAIPAFGSHWIYGKRFVGAKIDIDLGADWKTTLAGGIKLDEIEIGSRKQWGDGIASNAKWPLDDFAFVRIAAERDVKPEGRNAEPSISSDGSGTTNLVRAFINQDDYPRHEVEVELLRELNEIYAGDSAFLRISTREDNNGLWEIFLEEEAKGEIRLSQSGSSLKSVFIILAFLRLQPRLKALNWTKIVFAVEEPENNLHPALLRRLLNFLSRRRDEEGFVLVLTTHSPVGIDWASRRTDSQIIHVQNVEGVATAVTSTEYLSNRAILDDLDIRASDMLQANGIIWIEGPSDRIYIRAWLDLFTDGEIKEGVHYSMMFYGGRLLSHLESAGLQQEGELISILSLNRNAAMVIDSDRHQGRVANDEKKARRPRMNINATKTRIKEEVERMNGFVWVTEGREIENYVPNAVYERIVGNGKFNVGIYDELPEHDYLKQFNKNKVELAHAVAANFKLDDLRAVADLERRVSELACHIRSWNRD